MASEEEKRKRHREADARWRAKNPERAKQSDSEKSRRYYAKNIEQRRADARQWSAENPEKKKAAWAKWYAANREQQVARAVKRNKENPEKSRAAIKRWEATHPDKMKEIKTRWGRNHPEQILASVHVRNVRIRGGITEKFLASEIFDRDDWICRICHRSIGRHYRFPDGLSASLDHVIPISKGGDHTRANVQSTHLRCNMRKGNREMVA
jgi:5-methylcytosine-specific restriction endonuclease McrA